MNKTMMVGVALAGVLTAGVARAEFGPDTQIPGTKWEISVEKDTGTCVVGASFTNGYMIVVGQRGNSYVFTMSNTSLKLTKGNNYTVKVQFSDGHEALLTLTATMPEVLSALVKSEMITLMSRSNEMRFFNEAGKQIVSFELEGSSKALTLLGACADSFVGSSFGDGVPSGDAPFGQGKES